MVTPNDPLFASQWHFQLLGNIGKIWDEYTGAGVKVSVYDDGLQYTHPDLNDNYNATLHFKYGTAVYDPKPIHLYNPNPDAHGTSVAGIIAAEGNNGIGGVGVAFGADLTGINFLNDTRLSNEAKSNLAIRHASQFDVMSNSWGYEPLFQEYENAANPSSTISTSLASFAYIANQGRGGLGTIVVKAAGNEASNAQGDGTNTSRHLIIVAALTEQGSIQSYSNYGSNIFVAAGAAAVTTDLSGSAGYNNISGADGDYNSGFGGTSAATPVVSGVVALMLQAAPGLGWRDVQDVLATSAAMTGSIAGDTGADEAAGTYFQQIDAKSGSAWLRDVDSWNDGGRAISLDYGFGRVDAFAAVRLAEVWGLINGAAHTSANEIALEFANQADRALVYETGSGIATSAIINDSHLAIDHISVTVDSSYFAAIESANDLQLGLIDPLGTYYELAVGTTGMLERLADGVTWTFDVALARGADAFGTWTLELFDETDSSEGNSGRINSFGLQFYGSDWNNDNIHHITKDFLLATASNTAVLNDKVISDTNGGIDWLQMTTLEGKVVASLASGGVFSVNGITWGRIATGTQIENIITGDGNDRLTGNSAANAMHAMRGNDTVYGAAGADSVLGGTGNDYLYGEAGNDLVKGDGGNDHLYGGLDIDALYGKSGNDTIYGDLGNDSLNGGTGNDVMAGGLDDDRVYGSFGNDRLYGNDGNDQLKGEANDDLLYGGNGNDVLIGGDGDDVLMGGSGNDRIDSGFGQDALSGAAGQDEFIFRNQPGQDIIVDFQDNIDTLALDNRLWGNVVADITFVLQSFASLTTDGVLLHFIEGVDILVLGLTSVAALQDDIRII